jgi:hypothetical protein
MHIARLIRSPHCRLDAIRGAGDARATFRRRRGDVEKKLRGGQREEAKLASLDLLPSNGGPRQGHLIFSPRDRNRDRVDGNGSRAR